MNNKGFVLAETLIVSAVVAGILIFIYIQFSNLNKSYSDSYNYNTIEDLFSLRNVKEYVENDSSFINYLDVNLNKNNYIDITDCNNFIDVVYCQKLFELENIDYILVSTNEISEVLDFSNYGQDLNNFIDKVNSKGEEKYRLIAKFNDNTFSTVRFGDINE